MKKVFPVIVLLISLSVLGILFIQMSWIRNAIFLKRKQFQREIDNSLLQAREQMHGQFLQKLGIYVPNEQSKQYYLLRFTSQIFTTDEVQVIIDQSLKKYNIHQPFEFCITNIFKNPVIKSDGFVPGDMSSAYRLQLTSE